MTLSTLSRSRGRGFTQPLLLTRSVECRLIHRSGCKEGKEAGAKLARKLRVPTPDEV